MVHELIRARKQFVLKIRYFVSNTEEDTLKMASFFFKDKNLYRALLILVIELGFIFDLTLYIASSIKKATLGKDSSVPLTHHDPKDLGLICLEKKRKIRFRI